MKEIRVKLEGEHAVLGTVPAADVARLLILLEKAAAQAAAVVLHQPKTTTGRYKGPIEQAVHFRLVGLEEGSVTSVLELPETAPLGATQALDFEVTALGESAMEALMTTAARPGDAVVAKALLDLADGMGIGERYDSITFIPTTDTRPRPPVTLDGSVRKSLRAYVDAAPVPRPRADDLTGVLVEADFEKCTARLRTPTEAGIDVAFTTDQADAIHAALRQSSTVRGEVTYDPKTNVAKTVRLREIVRGIEQLVLDPGEYWSEPTFAELAEVQGSGQPVDPHGIYDAGATDEERDAVMAAIAELD